MKLPQNLQFPPLVALVYDEQKNKDFQAAHMVFFGFDNEELAEQCKMTIEQIEMQARLSIGVAVNMNFFIMDSGLFFSGFAGKQEPINDIDILIHPANRSNDTQLIL